MTDSASAPRESKIGAILSHLSMFYCPVVIPLIVYLIKKSEDPFTAEEAKEALNFHISLFIYNVILGIVSAVLSLILIGYFIAIVGFPVLIVFGAVFAIIAAAKASQGVAYRYPLTIRLVK